MNGNSIPSSKNRGLFSFVGFADFVSSKPSDAPADLDPAGNPTGCADGECGFPAASSGFVCCAYTFAAPMWRGKAPGPSGEKEAGAIPRSRGPSLDGAPGDCKILLAPLFWYCLIAYGNNGFVTVGATDASACGNRKW